MTKWMEGGKKERNKLEGMQEHACSGHIIKVLLESLGLVPTWPDSVGYIA